MRVLHLSFWPEFSILLERNKFPEIRRSHIDIEVIFGLLLKKLSADCLGSPPIFHIRLKMDIAPRDKIAT